MDLLGPLIKTISDLGALGVAAIVIWAMVTERLIPRGRLEDMRKEKDDAEHRLELERDRSRRP